MGYWRWCGCPPPYVNKWFTFTASIAVALCCGLTYCFAVWSDALKRTYGLRQDQLQLIASAANVGGYSAIISGLTYDALERHKRFGPRIVLLLGLAANAAGYLGLWAAVSGVFEASMWQLVVLAALAANGGTWGDTATLVTNVRNFPSSRGSVVGVLKACIGLSGSLFACVYSGLFVPDATTFLLFLAAAPVVVGLLALPFINHCSYVQRSETESGQHIFLPEGRFIFCLQALGTLAVYLISGATMEALYPLSRSARLAVTLGAGLLLLPLLLIPYGSGGLLSERVLMQQHLSLYHNDEDEDEEGVGHDEERGGGGGASCADQQAARTAGAAATWRSAAAGGGGGSPDKADGSSLVQPLLDRQEMDRDGDSAATAPVGSSAPPAAAGPEAPGRQERGQEAAGVAALQAFPELSPMQCLRSSNFWLLFLVLTIGMGAGLTLLNNLAQVAKALSGAAKDTPVLVSLFSVSNCAGRMALGYFPERLLHSRGTPRLLFLPLVSALMAATCLALAFAHLALLYPLAALAGFAFGGHWSLFPSFVSELFGLARFAANYSLVQLAPAIGSFGLAMGLAGKLYERALERHGGGSNMCVGQDCFQLTFLTLAALGVVATLCSVVLYRRNRGLYRLEYQEVHSYDQEINRHSSGEH